MKTRFASLLILLSGLVIGHGAEPAPKLVPRPLPGFALPQLPTAPPAAEPKVEAAAAQAPAAALDPATNNRARIMFIHRRATLPARLTADLAKPSTSESSKPATGGQGLVTRPVKVRIIPKSDIASLIAPSAEPKP